jgi:uncharacterized protein YutE (UPF0331/DUF86 family)
MVDKTLVLRKLADLESYQEQIKEYENITVAQYRNDWKTQRIVERTLQIMIETCADIATHIISDQKFRVPDTYADIFRVLSYVVVLKEEFVERLIKMVRFRNIVVHDYERIDPEIVVGILHKHLSDFSHFNNTIVNFIKTYR